MSRLSPMTSTSESTQRSRPVNAVAVVTHGRVDVNAALDTVRSLAEQAGASVVVERRDAALVIALAGDGTILRTLTKLLGSDVPVIGVNFGRVGFLASIDPANLERDLGRVLGGEYTVIELPTLRLDLNGDRHVAVNDVVATSATLGRMIELAWAVGGEDLGTIPCDGMICSTPSGSTAYNLSNGGPVLVRGLDAMAITFIAPHSPDAPPPGGPRGAELVVRNATADVEAAVLIDGHRSGGLAPGASLSIGLGEQRSLLATLPETTFFGRYRETFTSHG